KIIDKTKRKKEEIINKNEETIVEYGFFLDNLEIVRDTIRSGDTFGAILSSHGVSQVDILKIANDYKDTFDVRRIRKGKPYAIIKAKDSLNSTKATVYEKDQVEYSVI